MANKRIPQLQEIVVPVPTGYTIYDDGQITYKISLESLIDFINESNSGLTNNVKHWLTNENKVINSDETIVIAGNYVLSGSTLTLMSDDLELIFDDIDFNKYGQIFIGGHLLIIDSNIINNGLISVAGMVKLLGNSTITGTGILL
jgi:hypothetical protein